MKLRLKLETIWSVDPHDEGIANVLLHSPDTQVVSDYLNDAMMGDKEFSHPTATITEEED